MLQKSRGVKKWWWYWGRSVILHKVTQTFKKCKYVFSTFLILIFLRNKNESCDPYKKYWKLRNYVSRKTMFLYDFCTVFVRFLYDFHTILNMIFIRFSYNLNTFLNTFFMFFMFFYSINVDQNFMTNYTFFLNK